MNITRIFASAVVRKIAYILTGVAVWALLSLLGMGSARAAGPNISYDESSANAGRFATHASREAASAACGAAESPAAHAANAGGTWHVRYEHGGCTQMAGVNGFIISWNPLGTWNGDAYYGPAEAPAPVTRDGWAYTAGAACPDGYAPDPYNAGQCMDRDKCNALNTGGANTPRAMTGESKCVAGCEFKLGPGATRTMVDGSTNGLQIWHGTPSYTGNACSVSPAMPEGAPEEEKTPDPQECVPANGSLETVCVKKSGERCMSASTGKQVCWTPGETGEKTDGDTMQKRNAGPDAILPTLTLPSGDTLVQKNPPVTTTTTNVTTNTTTKTTTANYTTTQGTNVGAPGKDAGEKSDGTGTMPGTGGGDGDGKTASGGQNCEASGAPVVNGDPHLQMVATQAWATRCAVESKDAVTSTGEIGNCATNFTVTGPAKSAEVIKLKAIRETICGVDKNLKDGDPNGTGSVDGVGLEGEITDTPFAGLVREGTPLGGDGLNDSGFGWARTCPAMPTFNIFGTSVQFDNSIMCDWLSLGGLFVLMLAALASAKIMSGVAVGA